MKLTCGKKFQLKEDRSAQIEGTHLIIQFLCHSKMFFSSMLQTTC